MNSKEMAYLISNMLKQEIKNRICQEDNKVKVFLINEIITIIIKEV